MPGEPRGFTIIEVLATLTLVAVVVPVAVDGITLSLATAGYAKDYARAASLAQTKMDELIATGQWYDQQMEGDFGESWPEFTWAAVAGDWEEDATLVQLDVTVMWTRRGQPREVVLTTLIHDEAVNE